MTTTAPAPVLVFDSASTATRYTAYDLSNPTHAAYRGGHLLPHMSQQLGRDLCGERYAAQPRTLHLFKLTEAQRQHRNTPYLYLVQTPSATAETAFRTAEELYVWLRAYAVTMTPRPRRCCADFILTTGDPADWEPLEVRPV